ncbi:NUDIX domain-containing protein [Candidatus Gracilibacteria bacterium]|nr:NUDIX domain-containing protein [Candidatus Gracilibacteria bacterium]
MKIMRTGVYAILKYKDSIVVIRKGRGPFIGLYDLPGGKIEHSEKNVESLEREIIEEVGLNKGDFQIERLLSVEEDFVQHVWEGEEKDEHIIGIVYLVHIKIDNFDLSYIEQGGDAKVLKLIQINDKETPKTNILKKALEKIR